MTTYRYLGPSRNVLANGPPATALPVMVGDSGSGGTQGAVPAPSAGDATKFLRGDGTWAAGAGGGVTAHGDLTGLTGTDHHTQYHNDARGDARYSQLGHTHTASGITDFSEAVDDRVNALLVAGMGITLGYSDVDNTLTITAEGSSESGGGGGTLYTATSSSLAVGSSLTVTHGSDAFPTPQRKLSAYIAITEPVPFASPSTLDDEFSGSSLDGKWTGVNTAMSGTTTTVSGGKLNVAIDATATSSKLRAAMQAVPSGDWTAFAYLELTGVTAANYQWFGFTLANGTTAGAGSQANAGMLVQSGSPNYSMYGNNATNYDVLSSQTSIVFTSISAQSGLLLKLRKSGSTYYWSYATTAAPTTWLTEQTLTVGFTPTHLGISAVNSRAASVTAAWRWFRVVESNGNASLNTASVYKPAIVGNETVNGSSPACFTATAGDGDGGNQSTNTTFTNRMGQTVDALVCVEV